ncbi:hypothetical protein D3368_14125 [Salmonella enterica]|nr:hypothetical protein [Salmonella enterica]EDU5370222.1 hypothetical protein [Salmonella enterica subsp. enterica serovar Urbana]EAO8695188.1 hypothetical protein [Salmonella enterica]EAV3574053.1 hypothetical protein [Salmonella enterica]EBK1187114.1 hypothetical protein [Salmonella enterica]
MKPTYEELELQLEESKREFRAADATIHNLELKLTDMAVQLVNAESKCMSLAAESDKTSERMQQLIQIINNADNNYCMCGDAMKNHTYGGCGHPTGMFDYHYGQWLKSDNQTPATDAFLAEVRAQGVEMFADSLLCPDLDGSIRDFAAQIRKGVQS